MSVQFYLTAKTETAAMEGGSQTVRHIVTVIDDVGRTHNHIFAYPERMTTTQVIGVLASTFRLDTTSPLGELFNRPLS